MAELEEGLGVSKPVFPHEVNYKQLMVAPWCDQVAGEILN